MKGISSLSVVSSHPLIAIFLSLTSAPRMIFFRTELGDPGSEYFRILHSDASARNHLRTTFESNFQVSFLFQSASKINYQRSTCRQFFVGVNVIIASGLFIS